MPMYFSSATDLAIVKLQAPHLAATYSSQAPLFHESAPTPHLIFRVVPLVFHRCHSSRTKCECTMSRNCGVKEHNECLLEVLYDLSYATVGGCKALEYVGKTGDLPCPLWHLIDTSARQDSNSQQFRRFGGQTTAS